MALFGRRRGSNPTVGKAASEQVRRAGILITYLANQQVLAEIAEQLQVLVESARSESSHEEGSKTGGGQAGLGPLAFSGEVTRTSGSAVERSFASLPVTVQLRAVIERLIQLRAVGDFIVDEHFMEVMELSSPDSGTQQVGDRMLRTAIRMAAEHAVEDRSWFLLEATWEIDKVNGLIRLTRPVINQFARFDPHPDLKVVVNAPEDPQAWSRQGELAILSAPTVSASVFGTASEWDDASSTLSVTAIAVFDRRGGQEAFFWGLDRTID